MGIFNAYKNETRLLFYKHAPDHCTIAEKIDEAITAANEFVFSDRDRDNTIAMQYFNSELKKELIRRWNQEGI